MRGLLRLRQASSNFTNKNNSCLVLSHPYKTFTSLTETNPQQYQNHIFSSSPLNPIHYFHSCPSKPTLSVKIHGFLSNPLLSKQFLSTLSNTHFRVSTRSLTDWKVGLLRAPSSEGYPWANSSFGSYGRGRRSWSYQLIPDNVVFGLIIANAAVFILWRIADQEFMMKNFTVSLDNFKSGRVHTLIAYAFSHNDIKHILSNMIGLYFFGTNVAGTFGRDLLLKLYLAGAIGGSVFYLAHHAFMALSPKEQRMWVRSRASGLGASGAVNAIMLLYIFLHPSLNFIIRLHAILLGILLTGKDVLSMLEGNSNTSGSGHLGGAAVAAITWVRIRKRRF